MFFLWWFVIIIVVLCFFFFKSNWLISLIFWLFIVFVGLLSKMIVGFLKMVCVILSFCFILSEYFLIFLLICGDNFILLMVLLIFLLFVIFLILDNIFKFVCVLNWGSNFIFLIIMFIFGGKEILWWSFLLLMNILLFVGMIKLVSDLSNIVFLDLFFLKIL